jgi:hypothetical protein
MLKKIAVVYNDIDISKLNDNCCQKSYSKTSTIFINLLMVKIQLLAQNRRKKKRHNPSPRQVSRIQVKQSLLRPIEFSVAAQLKC